MMLVIPWLRRWGGRAGTRRGCSATRRSSGSRCANRRPSRRLARRTRFALAGSLAAAAAAAAIVVPAALPHGGGAFTGTAWAVTNQSNGTVTISLSQEFKDPTGPQRALRADGITAYVRSFPIVTVGNGTYPACFYNLQNDTIPAHVVVSEHFPPPRSPLGAWSWTIRPSAMPPGSALFLFFGTQYGKILSIGEPAVLRNRQAPVCRLVLVAGWRRGPGQAARAGPGQHAGFGLFQLPSAGLLHVMVEPA
jgi:hypothetical protein